MITEIIPCQQFPAAKAWSTTVHGQTVVCDGRTSIVQHQEAPQSVNPTVATQ